MKFENIRVTGFDAAFRGMRNPKESWHLSDSFFGLIDDFSEADYSVAEDWGEFTHPEYYGESFGTQENERIELEDSFDQWLIRNGILYEADTVKDAAFIGPKDMRLAQQLICGGSEHRKFLRQINVSVDITAPLYW